MPCPTQLDGSSAQCWPGAAPSAPARRRPDSQPRALSGRGRHRLLVNSAHDDVTLPERDRKDVPWKSFSDVTKGARVQSGLFTLYTKRENNYLSLAPTQLDRDYLLVTQLSQGIGELGLDGGSSVRTDLIRFHRRQTGSSSGW